MSKKQKAAKKKHLRTRAQKAKQRQAVARRKPVPPGGTPEESPDWISKPPRPTP